MSNAARYGLATPGVTLAGGYSEHGAWERDIGPEDFAAIATAADRLGYAYLACSEHVGIPPEVEAVRGGRYYDPLPFFGYLAALTSRIRFLTYVLVLAYSHPLAIAKRYGTLDRMSGGRLMLGVGVGSLKPEFDLLGLGGAEFAERGVRGDDAIRAIRAAMGRRMPEYSGPYYGFSGFIIDPCAVQQDMPIWIGGRSARSLRRAVELGDGWAPFGLSVPEMRAMIDKAKDQPAWEARERPLELALRHEGQLDPVGEPGLAAERVAAVFEAGATFLHVGMASRSAAHYAEQLEALAELEV
jgi:probable F420-dependent oxidoreductase